MDQQRKVTERNGRECGPWSQTVSAQTLLLTLTDCPETITELLIFSYAHF